MHLIGYFGDNDAPGAAFQILFVPPCPKAQAAASGFVDFYALVQVGKQKAAGGKVGSGYRLHEIGGLKLWPIDQADTGVQYLPDVVGGDGCGHADGDTRRAVGQKVGKAGRKHCRLPHGAVIGVVKIYGVALQILQHGPGDLGESGFGVAHGGSAVAIDVAEVALTVHQGVTRGEILSQTHHGVISGLIAVGMELADDVADHTGRFFRRRGGLQAQGPHGVEDAAVDRLQTVADVRQGAADDGGKRVCQIAALQLMA